MKSIKIKFLLSITMALLFSLFATQTLDAQTTYKTKGDTTVNADTSIIYIYSSALSVPSKVRSIQATVKNVSGTTGGYVLLQGTNDLLVWKDINTDTLIITGLSSSGYASKIWTSEFKQSNGTQYARFRLWFKTTGTQTSIMTGTMLRRNDE